tara:strand:+ start:169 stop:1170 length:1002 start_codon:yes stop_codon:yes gene_type:complete
MSEHDDKVLEVRELLAQNLGDPDFDAYVSGIGINSMEDFDTNSNSPEFVNHIHSILIEGAEPTPALSANIKRPRNPTFAPTINESMDEFQEKNASEPMDLAWRLLKQGEDEPRRMIESVYNYSEPATLAFNQQIKGPCQMCGDTQGPYYDVGYRNPVHPKQDAVYTLCEPCLDRYSFNFDTWAPYGKDIVLRAKRNMSPEARRHKLEYDTEYESSPERVKYREELNRERHRRGIYGKKNHMDVSHTEGGKLTLESEHDNRARHFKERGTLREVMKSTKEDLELLRNLLQGPMDEQDKKIGSAVVGMLNEREQMEGSDIHESPKHHDFFGGVHL